MRAGLNCPLEVCNPSAATPVILAQMVTLTIVRRFARATTIVAIHMRLNNKVRRKVNRNSLGALYRISCTPAVCAAVAASETGPAPHGRNTESW